MCAGADTVRFKAEVNFDGREVARAHVSRLDLETVLKVRPCKKKIWTNITILIYTCKDTPITIMHVLNCSLLCTYIDRPLECMIYTKFTSPPPGDAGVFHHG